MCVFGVVVVCAIYFSGKKAFQLRREEKAKELADRGEYMKMPETDAEAMDLAAVNEACSPMTSQKSVENATPESADLCTHDYNGIIIKFDHTLGEEYEENLTEELLKVKADEAAHFTPKRMLFYFVNFCFLFVA